MRFESFTFLRHKPQLAYLLCKLIEFINSNKTLEKILFIRAEMAMVYPSFESNNEIHLSDFDRFFDCLHSVNQIQRIFAVI